jgi:hypothetical protein
MTFTDAAQPISILLSLSLSILCIWWMAVNRKYWLYAVPVALVALHSLLFSTVIVLDDVNVPTQSLTDWAAALRVQFLLTLLTYMIIMPGSPVYTLVGRLRK